MGASGGGGGRINELLRVRMPASDVIWFIHHSDGGQVIKLAISIIIDATIKSDYTSRTVCCMEQTPRYIPCNQVIIVDEQCMKYELVWRPTDVMLLDLLGLSADSLGIFHDFLFIASLGFGDSCASFRLSTLGRVFSPSSEMQAYLSSLSSKLSSLLPYLLNHIRETLQIVCLKLICLRGITISSQERETQEKVDSRRLTVPTAHISCWSHWTVEGACKDTFARRFLLFFFIYRTTNFLSSSPSPSAP